MAKTIRVLLADDHTLMRAGLRELLERIEGVNVIGEASDGQEALDLVGLQLPDVVVLDISMPRLNGLEAAERIRKSFKNVRVIILSMFGTEEYVTAALRAGASGYLLKDAAVSELEVAIRAAAAGDMYLSPAISKQVVDQFLDRDHEDENPLEMLTKRQREVLQLIVEGNTAKAIATLLGLSVKTVETHRADIMDRLDIHDVPGLVRFAMRTGLLLPES